MAVVNVDQARAWDGDEGERWTEHEERYNASARRHTRHLLDAARVSADTHALDVGCGCGETTREVARFARSGMALGVDLSARMIERARERSRAEGLTNARFEQADAQVCPFEMSAFDLAISRFGAMFFNDPVAAFRNIGRALRPGGRLALLAWQALERNEWQLSILRALAAGRQFPMPPVDAPGPFGLADADRVRRILAEAGFEGVELEEIAEPIRLGADADDALVFVRSTGIAAGMLRDLDEAAAARALEALRKTLAAHEGNDGVLLDSRAWLITARRP
jgi:ubiquinone/menaquinone biosynthesis C-methylase UbiE